MSERKDKQIKPDQGERHGLVSEVVVPIAQAGVAGLGIGAANAWVTDKVGGGEKPPPDKDK